MRTTLIALLLLVAPVFAPLFAQSAPTVAEQYLLQMANRHRADLHLPPLVWDAALARAALAHATIIAQSPGPALHRYPGEPDTLTRAANAGAHFSSIAENVAGNGNTTVEIESAWMHSPVHRANILDPNLNAVGISVVQSHGLLFAVEDFARSVQPLGSSQVEQQALGLFRSHGLQPKPDRAAQQDARRSCLNESATLASAPSLILHWEGPDLNQLADTVREQLPQPQAHTVAVGSCPASKTTPGFTTFHLAVLIY